MVDTAARYCTSPVAVGLRIHFPEESAFSATRIDLVNGAPSVSDIDHSVLNDRRAFQPAMRPHPAALNSAKVHRPRDLEILDIALVYLSQAGEAGRRIVLVMLQPIARFAIGID